MQSSSAGGKRLPERPSFSASTPTVRAPPNPPAPRGQANQSSCPVPPPLPPPALPVFDSRSLLTLSKAEWPKDAGVKWRVFEAQVATSSADKQADAVMELGRRKVVSMWESGIWEGLVGSLRVTDNARRHELWVFETGDLRSSGKLGDASFNGLSETNAGHFHPSWLYPCSKCIALPQPCENCPSPTLASAPAAVLRPRERYRLPLWMFLVSLRDKILHGLAESLGGCRIGDSLLLPERARHCSEWETGWAGADSSMNLTHVGIHLSLQNKYLLVEPIVQPSPYTRILSAESLYLTEGAAVRLLPHGYMAYYLSACEVPSVWSSFEPFMDGLGARAWLPQDGQETSAVKCWLVTPTRQGPERGLEVIWPLRLVVEDLSRDKLPCLPSGFMSPLPREANHSSPLRCSMSSSFPLHPDVLRVTLSGPGSRLVTEASALDKFTEEKALVDRLAADEELSAEIKLILGDATTCADFTRDAVQARDAARSGRLPEKDRDRKEGYAQNNRPRLQSTATPYARLIAAHNRMQGSGVESGAPIRGFASSYPLAMIRDFRIGSDYSDAIVGRNHRIPSQAVPLSTESFAATHLTPLAALLDLAAPSSSSSERSSSPDVLSQRAARSRSLSEADRPINVDLSRDVDMRERSFSPKESTPSPRHSDWAAGGTSSRDTAVLDVNRDYSKGRRSSPSHMPSRPSGPAARPFVEDTDGYGLVTDDDFAFFDGPTPLIEMPLQMPEQSEFDSFSASPPTLLSPPRLDHYTSPLDFNTGMADTAFGNDPRHSSESVVSGEQDRVGSEAESLATTEEGASGVLNFERPMSPSLSSPSTDDIFRVLPLQVTKDPKYAVGKFALCPLDVPSCGQKPAMEASFDSWSFLRKEWFEAHSDPHTSLVAQLRGSKRDRNTAFGPELGDAPFKRSRNSWSDMDESKTAVERRRLDRMSIDDVSEGTPEDETLLVADQMNGYDSVDDASPPLQPLPSPLTSTMSVLAHGRLHMSQLSKPLRAESSSSAPAPPIAALTPVSPASYPQVQDAEEAANMLCSQAIYDPITAECIAAEDRTRLWMQDWTVCHLISRLQLRLFRTTPSLSPVILGDVCDKLDHSMTTSSHLMKKTLTDDPSITWSFGGLDVAVGLGGAVVNLSSPALRFWDKLGLGPVGGQKDVLGYVFYERPINSGVEIDTKVKEWLDRLGHTYMGKGYGRHRAGETGADHGLVPGQLDRIEAQLSSVLKGLSVKTPHVVFYVFVSAVQLSPSALAIQKLASLLAGRRVELDGGVLDTTQVLVHFLPEEALLHASESSYSKPGIFGFVATAIYERILRAVSRTKTRTPYKVRPAEKRAIQFPAFTISREPAPSLDFVWEWPPPAMDLVDPGLLLHVGYCVLPEWLLVTCVDQLGEVHAQKVWTSRQGDKSLPEAAVVAKVWAFSWKIARRSRKAWRVVIARMGAMRYTEIEAWESLLRLMTHRLPLNLHVSIVSVQPAACRQFRQTAGEVKTPATPVTPEAVTLFADASVSTAGLFLAERTTAQAHILPLSRSRILTSDEVYEAQTFDASDPPASWLRPLYTAWLVQGAAEASFDPFCDWSSPTNALMSLRVDLMHHATADSDNNPRSRQTVMQSLLQSYQQLTILAREKMPVYKRFGPLPWHLAALCLMDRALNRM